MVASDQTLTAILVDDEINARENLRYLIETMCEDVLVVAEAATVDAAVQAIDKHHPQIVFLDIEMPQKNGFQLFEAFKEINFQVIFITAYDSYAIKAFQVAAIDYLLKPVDIALLQNAIEKVKTHVNKSHQQAQLQVLQENKKKITKIAVPYKSDYAIIKVDDIICIEADRMYAVIHTAQAKQFTIAKKLHYYEELFCEENVFIRVHRSWIINTEHIETYSKKARNVQLLGNQIVPVSKGYKEAFEKLFVS